MSKLFSLDKKRQERLEEKRRSFERIIFQDLINVYSLIEQGEGLFPLIMNDISHDGLQFEIPWAKNVEQVFAADTDHILRFYFTKESYLSLQLTVKHAQKTENKRGEWVWRCGCQFDQKRSDFSAMEKFIEFLYDFAKYSQRDTGQQKVYFL